MKNVFVLYTGGTFGMAKKLVGNNHSLFPSKLADIINILPNEALADKGINAHIEALSEPLDSSSLVPNDWLRIAQYIEANYLENDGFVVIHGTDTMAYTSSALAFIIQDLTKPVVVTGSKQTIFDAQSDALANYYNAVCLAADTSAPQEVMVLFGQHILRGCRACKVGGDIGFTSPKYPILGECKEIGKIEFSQNHAVSKKENTVADNTPKFAKKICNEVIDFSLFPGIDASFVRSILSEKLGKKSIKGAIVRSWGAGNGPKSIDFYHELAEAINNNGIIIVNVTQCLQGRVFQGNYGSGLGFVGAGVVSGKDLTAEAAISKLMVVLADDTLTNDEKKDIICNNQVGEMI